MCACVHVVSSFVRTSVDLGEGFVVTIKQSLTFASHMMLDDYLISSLLNLFAPFFVLFAFTISFLHA